MHELNVLREFRSDASLPPETQEQARARLEAAIKHGRRRSRRPLLLAAAAALLLVGGGTAYALAREFLVGDPAPPAVQEQARLLNEVKGELIPRVHEGPKIRVEETRLAALLDASTGRVYLWVAPSERGDCLFEQIVGTEMPDGRPNLSGGCGLGEGPIDSTLSGSRVRDGRWLSVVYGRVDEAVARLQVNLEGRALEVPLQGRFFLFELPGVADSELPDVELVAYDRAGSEIARRKHDVPADFSRVPRPLGDLSGATPLLEIETRRTRKPIRLYVLERGGERCVVLVSPGGTSRGCGGRRPRPRDLFVAPNQIGAAPRGLLLLWGEVGREIDGLELRFEDGRVERLPLAGGFTLYQVDPDDFAAGRRPVVLIGRDDGDDVIAERKLGPWR